MTVVRICIYGSLVVIGAAVLVAIIEELVGASYRARERREARHWQTRDDEVQWERDEYDRRQLVRRMVESGARKRSAV